MNPQCVDCSAAAECSHDPPEVGTCPDKRVAHPSGFHFVRFDGLEVKPTDWLLRGLLERDALGLVYGKYASLKSFFALDVSFSVATGTPCLGHEVKHPGPVLYVAGEGHGGLAKRGAAWSKARGVSLDGVPIFFSTMAANLTEPVRIAVLQAAVADVVKQAGNPALVVLDTWSRNMGGDENSSLDSAAAVAALDALRKPYGATCLIVHHSGWDASRTRGSTVLMAAADFAFQCSKADDGVATLTCEKLKDGAPPEEIHFDLEDVVLDGVLDEEGNPATSAVIRARLDYHAPSKSSAPRGKNQSLALTCLERCTAENASNLEKAGLDPSSAKVSRGQLEAECRRAGMDRRRVRDAVDALLLRGAAHVESGGYIVLGPPGESRDDLPLG